MWHLELEKIAGGLRCCIGCGESFLTFRDYLDALASNRDFARWYSESLRDVEMDAYFWEHPPIFSEMMGDQLEFVLVDAPSLACLRADSRAFRRQLAGLPATEVAVFENLGGDALLIAPADTDDGRPYAHLAAYLRSSSAEQSCALWSEAAKAVQARMLQAPIFLSTSGLGVPRLHIRLDARPKYYQYLPYKVVHQAR